MQKFERIYLPFRMKNGTKLFYNQCKLKYLSEDLNNFFHDKKYVVSRDFSIATLFSQGIKYNNAVEGYHDDLSSIDKIIKEIDIKDLKAEKRQRVLNLYKGYKYILEKNEINKDSIRELYGLLSEGLLEEEDVKEMGKYYRNNPVYIHYSSNMQVQPDEGFLSSEIDSAIANLIEFINDSSFGDGPIDAYIKSQIAHFYFVHVHPYYDINGRTSRTLAMWHLVKNDAHPFLIFNRGILLDKPKYYRIIRDVTKFSNVSFFLNYLLETAKVEFEKEYIINTIELERGIKLSQMDRQTIYNIISFKKSNTILDITTIYNRYNDRKKPLDVYQIMLEPLINKGIIEIGRKTNKIITNTVSNSTFNLVIEEKDEIIKKYTKHHL